MKYFKFNKLIKYNVKVLIHKHNIKIIIKLKEKKNQI